LVARVSALESELAEAQSHVAADKELQGRVDTLEKDAMDA
jgi:hypothetical protein